MILEGEQGMELANPGLWKRRASSFRTRIKGSLCFLWKMFFLPHPIVPGSHTRKLCQRLPMECFIKIWKSWAFCWIPDTLFFSPLITGCLKPWIQPNAQYGHYEIVNVDVMLSLGKTNMDCQIHLFNLVNVYWACSMCAHYGGHWNFTVSNTNSTTPSIELSAWWRTNKQ